MIKTRTEIQALADTLGGMPIWAVIPGSVASRAGIRYGDIVLAVNGAKTPTLDDFLAARELRADGATILYFRDGETHEVELVFDRAASSGLSEPAEALVNDSQREPKRIAN